MAYTPNPTWVDGQAGGTPITAAALQHIESGIAAAATVADDAATALTGKASTTHKTSHATGGSDAIAPADIGAATDTALSALDATVAGLASTKANITDLTTVTRVTVTAAGVTSSSTTFVATGLQIVAGANEAWEFTALVHYDGDATASVGNISFKVTGPSGGGVFANIHGLNGAATNTASGHRTEPIFALDTATGALATVGTGNARAACLITGYVTSAATAGTFALMFNQAAASATPTKVYGGSVLTAAKIA